MLNAKIIDFLKARQLYEIETKLDRFLQADHTSESRRRVNGLYRVELWDCGVCVAQAESRESFADAASHAVYALSLWQESCAAEALATASAAP